MGVASLSFWTQDGAVPARKKSTRRGRPGTAAPAKPATAPKPRAQPAPERKGPPKRKARSAASASGSIVEKRAATRIGAASERPRAPDDGFLVVGIGGSAGSLPALRDLLSRLTAGERMAFVVMTHQDPKVPSFLQEILGKATELPVYELTGATKIEPDHVYVAPPGRYVAIRNGQLTIEQAIERGHPPLPIDFFFRELARERQDRAVAIVVSGTGADGTLGLQAVRAESGLTLVQDPTTAEFPGMPTSAVSAGVVDVVLPISEMPQRLVAHAREILSRPRGGETYEAASAELERIMALIRSRVGHDFSAYKRGTLLRRIERRMAVRRVKTLREYVGCLKENPDEIDALWRDWLIGVSRFFRDPEVFQELGRTGLPGLLASREEGSPLRIWVPACASGEEAYSIAMLVLETLEQLGKHLDVQIFATDLDPSAVQTARLGRYPEGIAADVEPRRLKRFFVKEDRHYQVKKELRDLVVFAVQNVLQDPPFSRVDMISCRNLLIYLVPTAQQNLLPVFHYSLNPGGLLLLGASESVTGLEQYFDPIDKRSRLFRRSDAAPPLLARHWTGQIMAGAHAAAGPAAVARKPVDLADLMLRQLADRFAPPAAVVDEQGQIQQIHGRLGAYLEPAQGRANMNILEMAREGLRNPLSAALREAMTSDVGGVQKAVRVRTNGDWRSARLSVRRLHDPRLTRQLLLVSFEQTADAPVQPRRAREAVRGRMGAHDRAGRGGVVAQLEQELKHSRQALQSMIDELQASNQELAAANEEVQSVNEELQSTNEELQTSKEETQSLNEELHTANSELTSKVQALEEARDDLLNLINSIEIATIFLDEQLRVKRFTPQAKKVVRLIDTDVGRPLDDLVRLIEYPDLLGDAHEVVRSLHPSEKEASGPGGRWYSVRMRPYRTARNAVEGLILTFVDITEIKQMERAQAARVLAESVVDAVREPLLVLDASLHVIRANRAFGTTFGVAPEATERQPIAALAEGRWKSPELQQRLQRVATGGESFEVLEVEAEVPEVGPRRLVLNARRIATRDGAPADLILLSIHTTPEASPPPS
jgi:two-component system CheB/CheR fusion protein